MKEDKSNIGALIEQYRWYIGGLLLVLVLASGGWLIYFQNQARMGTEEKLSMLENRITNLENVDNIPAKPVVTSIPSVPAPESQPKADQPLAEKIAGVSITSSSKSVTGMININTATAEQLDTLPGIGTTYAQRIIEYRQTNGGFKSIDEIKNVKGIGEKTFEKFRDKITVQ